MPRRAVRGRGVLAAVLATAAVAVPGTAGGAPVAADTTDYSITIDSTAMGPEIADTMYGVFLEDINSAADGGLYPELVRNRSFEFNPADSGSYTGLTAWRETATGGATGSLRVVDDAERLNERNRNYLRLDLDGGAGAGAGYGVSNAGFHTGMALTAGDSYTFSVWARTDNPAGTPLTVSLRTAAGQALAADLAIDVRGDEWTKYSATVTPTTSATDGSLVVTAGGGGTVRLDMVSLFPEETYKNRPNGLRKDLAEKIAALNPGFLRFPGGCLVNTGSHEAYEAPNWPRKRSYQWKDTVGPIEERATNHNFWGYNQTYGLGYFEYFQFAEDIGAMPLPVVPALVTGCGENRATDDPILLQRHIQDTLDLIEFANGPVDSTWGRLRAEMGHPEPFGLTHVQVGNEENLPDAFFERFVRFRAAIEAEYPDITVVSNSGPAPDGATFDRLWALNRQAGVELVDEHYYVSPQWMLENNARYDSYDREGPEVFLGEYASRGNTHYNALAEAAYMTGLERNADVVRLASYAPVLAHEDSVQWSPDLIWFDNSTSWSTPNYEVQRLFGNNVGDAVVPSRATGTPALTEPITGAVGLSTWATSAAYDDVRVVSADGTELFADDFSQGAARWTHAVPAGTWTVQDGAYLQTDTAATNTLVTAGDPAWRDYDLHLKATKRSGAEGFLIAFGVRDTGNYYWWNLGGWNNTQSAVEKATAGTKETLIADGTTIETGREYDVHIQVRGTEVKLFLDGQEWGSFVDENTAEPFRQVVTRDDRTGELIVKVVNAQDTAARTRIDLGDGVRVNHTARVTTLAGDPTATHDATNQPIRPVESRFRGVDNQFSYTFEPNSVTFLRIRAR
ncbi:alpha-L-arabinofuranosidase C-terminal domain-containing protein [Allostreptomyces psammosilenae]|uniref:non-reducing end alpha-L-arabinofuranosidase n=1 Tax=Allostreptomyces psammosilenae TaxID=1892865 RepID=A0A853A087_9ACTN|nr:alpha-L-arabinofuranosidase C-terminal domain-containing protein [Allostreptomyces psammosilenae]NYI03932.1 alpha-L-arabinofuranosidase [Allostreptomyces psammosilenae]